MKLFMVLLGGEVDRRHTEQHDIFFGIGAQVSDLKADMEKFWAGAKLHIDAWREITVTDGYQVTIVERNDVPSSNNVHLYFINLGGYRPNEFDELHHKMLAVAADQHEAVRRAKQSLFFKTTGFEGAVAHIDDKYGVDVDNLYNVEDILPEKFKQKYSILLTQAPGVKEDPMHLGYLPFSKLG